MSRHPRMLRQRLPFRRPPWYRREPATVVWLFVAIVVGFPAVLYGLEAIGL